MKEEIKQTQLSVAHKEQGVQLITDATRIGFNLHLAES